jgi:hypothetical protein
MRFGIGGDRFILVRDESEIDLGVKGISGWIVEDEERLIYINYLGKRVPFCGNATRVVGFINMIKKNLKDYVVWAEGPKRVFLNGNLVGIELEAEYRNFGEFSTVRMEGVKHMVFPSGNVNFKPFLENSDYHINFYRQFGEILFVRTWEQNHPSEALGCATGSLSAGIDHIMRKGVHSVFVKTLSGDWGRVSMTRDGFCLENPIEYEEG